LLDLGYYLAGGFEAYYSSSYHLLITEGLYTGFVVGLTGLLMIFGFAYYY